MRKLKHIYKEMEKLSDAHFPDWLESVENVYRTLTSEQKTITFNHLLKICEPSQLYQLQQKLQNLTSRDFIRCLPIELVEYVLDFFDPTVVCRLCLVSKSWHDVISDCDGLWRKACENLGIDKSIIHQQKIKGKNYKSLYLKLVRWVNKFSAGHYFEEMTLTGHDGRVMATFYKDGILATGGDDRTVRFWNCDTGECMAIISTHTTCDLKFSDKYLVTASYDATAACWDRLGRRGDVAIAKYIGHTSGVSCVDFSENLNITVTGSADKSIKVWSFRESYLLHTLSDQQGFGIRKIYLQYSCQNEGVIINFQTDASCFQWTLSSDIVPTEADSLSGKNSFQLVHFPFYFYDVNRSQKLHFSVVQCKHERTPSQGAQTGQDEFILGCAVMTQENHIVSVEMSILGVGELFHIQYVHGRSNPRMCVVNNRTGIPLCTVLYEYPRIRSTSFEHNVFVGATSWLNGFPNPSENPWCGVVMGAALCDNSIRLIKWKQNINKT